MVGTSLRNILSTIAMVMLVAYAAMAGLTGSPAFDAPAVAQTKGQVPGIDRHLPAVGGGRGKLDRAPHHGHIDVGDLGVGVRAVVGCVISPLHAMSI